MQADGQTPGRHNARVHQLKQPGNHALRATTTCRIYRTIPFLLVIDMLTQWAFDSNLQSHTHVIELQVA